MNSRPTKNDQGVREEAAKKASKRILNWLRCMGDDPSDEDVAMGIARKAVKSYSGNGYEIAKDVEDTFMVDPDAELVEILDSVCFDLDSALDEATRTWVEQNSIKCPYGIGDLVSFKHGRENLQGKIEKIDEKRATSTILVEGRSSKPIVKYEDMTLVQGTGQ